MRALQLVAVLAASVSFADAHKQHKQGEKVSVLCATVSKLKSFTDHAAASAPAFCSTSSLHAISPSKVLEQFVLKTAI
jgi:hypothetical protein